MLKLVYYLIFIGHILGSQYIKKVIDITEKFSRSLFIIIMEIMLIFFLHFDNNFNTAETINVGN